ncbi:MAG: oligoendopeptidase F [Acidobacteriota bacterium]
MLKIVFCQALAGALVLGMALPAAAGERSEVDPKYQWKLTDIYATPEMWEASKAELQKGIPRMAGFKGRLGESAGTLYEALSALAGLDKELSRLLSYAAMTYDQDTRVSANLERLQAGEQVAAEFGAAVSYLRPEILAMDPARVEAFVAEEPRLKDYKPYLDNILRMKAHTLTPAEEQVVARALGQMGGAADAVYGIFTNADMPYPEVELISGEKVRMDAAAYTKYRASQNREDRMRVFQKFWGKYAEFKRTLGTTLYSAVKGHIFTRDVRKYDSCLQASLDRNNIPVEVYKQLIADVHRNLPVLHRYLKLRQKMMGVDQLRYEDLYASIIQEVDLQYSPEEAMKLTLEACAPLGPEYMAALQKGYESGWVDFMPSTGKRSGAYSNGSVYDVHPFQLLNFMGTYEDVSTLAHESGHSMHSYLSNKKQPYITADYSIFVAEVASTLNENLLLHHMLKNTKDDATRLYLLGSALDNMRQTLFRQTLFAEFEMTIHEMAERGETLSGDNMSALYLRLLKEYYGSDQGVCAVDDLYGVEWAYIPHFYYNFYVYQYATSLTASTYIADAIRQEASAKKPASKARDAYIGLLSAGSSKYPIDVLKDAGVDMTTSAPFDAAMREMDRIMDEIEAILSKKK